MDEQLQKRTELELPAIRAWARAELTGYSDADLAAVVDEWSRSLRTRRELYWLEGALARRQNASVDPLVRRSRSRHVEWHTLDGTPINHLAVEAV